MYKYKKYKINKILALSIIFCILGFNMTGLAKIDIFSYKVNEISESNLRSNYEDIESISYSNTTFNIQYQAHIVWL